MQSLCVCVCVYVGVNDALAVVFGVWCLQMIAALYQNFVVSGFGVEGDQLKRYEAGQGKLAGILGLDDADKLKVRRSLFCFRFFNSYSFT